MGKLETVSDFIFLSSKITADGDCSHEIKRHLLFGRKVMINLDRIFKSRDITLPTKVCLVKAMVYPVVMYRCESWTIKKAEHWRIDAFELWCWRRPSDCKEIKPVNPKGNQPWIFIGKTNAEAEPPILWPSDWKSVGKVMSLLFNMLSRLVITFLPRSKRLLISWWQSPSAVILEPPTIKSLTVSMVSLFAMKCWDQMPWS